MQFSQLYGARLDEELGTDDSTRLFTDVRRKYAINEGLRQFADLTECFTKESTMASSNAVGEYDLLSTVNIPDADFIRVSKQQPEYRRTSSGSSGSTAYTAGDDLRYATVQWLDQYEPGWRNSTGGTPRYYYERVQGGKRLFGLYPPPRLGSSESGRVRLPYVARPSSLTGDTQVPFKDSSLGTRHDLEPYQMAYVHYGAYQLEKLRLQTEESQRQLDAFMTYVQRFLGELTPKGGRMVKVVRNYFGDARRRGPARGGLNPWPTDRWGDR